MEVAQLAVRSRMSAPDADAWSAASLTVGLRIDAVPRIHRPAVARLRSAIPVAAAAAVAAFPSIAVLGRFSTVYLLLHMKDFVSSYKAPTKGVHGLGRMSAAALGKTNAGSRAVRCRPLGRD